VILEWTVSTQELPKPEKRFRYEALQFSVGFVIERRASKMLAYIKWDSNIGSS
jgi:hypothetical protein